MHVALYENGEYLEKVPDWHASDGEWKATKIFKLLQARGVAPRTVCDVGCGAGEILVHLQRRLPKSTRFVGYDISSQAISICQSKGNNRLRFQQGDFARDATGETFDLLLLLDVLEHVPDYMQLLSTLRSRARRFVFHIPLEVSVQSVLSGSRQMLEMRERFGHLHHFTAETAIATLGELGFAIEDLAYTWDNEADGLPPMAPGWQGRARYPLRCAAWALESLAFRYNPELTARLRPAYNLLVLAAAT